MMMNPVLSRELRERMRTGRAFVVIGVFLLMLTLTAYLVYQGANTTGQIETDLARQTRLGRDLYEWVLFVMLALVLFFVPGLTAGDIAGEGLGRDGKGLVAIYKPTRDVIAVGMPQWAPDGKRLIFLTARLANRPADRSQ